MVKDDEEASGEGEGEEGIKSGVSWEATMRAPDGDESASSARVFLPFEGFKAVYRGREVEGRGGVRRGGIRRVGIMMRSFFGEQEGGFGVEVWGVVGLGGGGGKGVLGRGEGGGRGG